MKKINLDSYIEKVYQIVKRHELSEGVYARYLWQDEKGTRELGINEYGCADAANIFYTIGRFEQEPGKRKKAVEALQGLQNPQTGLFYEKTHHTIHTTAHCIAALELFDAQPLYPLKEYDQYMDAEQLYAFLEALPWAENPWGGSHRGAGLYAACTITGKADLKWKHAYFDWLTGHCDPDYGMSYHIVSGKAIPQHHMAGWFHYLFNFNHEKVAIPYPDKLIDSCIEMYRNNEFDRPFCGTIGFLEVDWIFCMNRASRQTDHRFREVKELIEEVAEQYINYLLSLDPETDDGLNDLHKLFGSLCALSELQLALPGKIETTTPLKQVLDRRPFI